MNPTIVDVNKLAKIQALINRLAQLDEQIKWLIHLANYTASKSILACLAIGLQEQRNNTDHMISKSGDTIVTRHEIEEGPKTFMGMPIEMVIQDDPMLKPKKEQDPDTFAVEVNESSSLKILAIVLEDKKKEREEIVVGLKKLGIKC